MNSLPITINFKLNKKKINLFLLALIAILWLLNSLQSSQPNQRDALTNVPTPQAEVLSQPISTSAATITPRQIAKVLLVIDGDTIKLEDGTKLRYIGIDTPETKDPKKGIECFGQEATDKNKELVEGKTVELEKDVSETDRYGRLLRYVYVDGVMVNELMVKDGFAKASSYPPDIKYQALLAQAERQAREEEKGLWSSLCP